jgi:hypothetical protein
MANQTVGSDALTACPQDLDYSTVSEHDGDYDQTPARSQATTGHDSTHSHTKVTPQLPQTLAGIKVRAKLWVLRHNSQQAGVSSIAVLCAAARHCLNLEN